MFEFYQQQVISPVASRENQALTQPFLVLRLRPLMTALEESPVLISSPLLHGPGMPLYRMLGSGFNH